MDFTTELAAFQGAIISADNVNQVSNLTSKGGNEEKVKFFIQHIKKFLKTEQYADETGLNHTKISSIRKFAMYIILNTDMGVINHMVELTELEPVLWSIPGLPKYLMCEMIWLLHMETFVYEVISQCWPQLGLEVAQAFLENFKYFSPTECLDKLRKLSTACYALLCKLHCFQLDDPGDILTPVSETFQKFLKLYTDLPNKHRLDALSSDDLYKFKGEHFKSILNLVYDCATMYTRDTNPNCDDPLYRLTYSIQCITNTTCKVCESPNELVLEYVNNNNIFLLDIFKQVVMDISIDIFCAWCEFEEDGKSMQQTIGELCDKVQITLEGIRSVSGHPVVTMIQPMARKPTDIKDVINTTDIPTILDNLNKSGQERLLWVHALVYKEHLFQHKELVTFIKDNVFVFDDKECFELFNAFNVAVDSLDRDLLLHTKLKLFNECNVLDKHKILKEHFRDKIFNNTMMSTDFIEQRTEVFNKFIADIDVDFSDILTLFYQNPCKVYTKMLGLATQNTKLIEPMLNLMIFLKDYTEYCYDTETEPSFIVITRYILNKGLQEAYSCNILKFICELKKNNIISSSQLLMLVIMPSIHQALTVKNFSKIDIQVQLLTEAYKTEELLSYRAPMLVMMGQIMEAVRLRNLGSFQIQSLNTLQLVVKFQKSIMNTYRQVIPDTDGNWLRQKLEDLNQCPQNFYYFKSLWNVEDKTFFETITNTKPHKRVNLDLMCLHLMQVLPCTILEEWYLIWDNFRAGKFKPFETLRLFQVAVKNLTIRINSSRNMNAVTCLLYCYANLIQIMRYKFLKEPLTTVDVVTCSVLLAHNLTLMNEADISDVEPLIAPLFAYLAEKKNDYSAIIPQFFEHTKYIQIVKRFFPND